MIGPKAGPKKGAMMNAAAVNALSLGANKSALLPPPIARTGPPAIPAKSLQTIKLPNVFDNPAPIMKRM